jgi:cytochrome d ubiquinol oxidase subunit I
MVTAAYLTTAFVVGGVGAFYLWTKRYEAHGRMMLAMATLMAFLVAPFQLIVGDLHGLNTLEHQPAKVAAMEGIWETEKGAPLRLFAIPDEKNETNHHELTIPYGASLVLTHKMDGEIRGLKSWPKEERPPVAVVFWSFRVMVGLGILMILLGVASAWAYYRDRLFTSRWLKLSWMAMMPSGFIALLAGWFVTEVGRQPYTAYGVLKTAHGVTPAIIGPQVAWSLFAFVVVYTLVFGAGSYYIIKLIRKGIPVAQAQEQFYVHGMEAILLEVKAPQGGQND